MDIIRAVAALLVMVGHLRALFFASWPAVSEHSTISAAMYFVTGFGHQAVLVFFVLSGYLVGGSVLRAIRQHAWSSSEYLSRRLARLYAVYIPALIIGAVLDIAGASLFDGGGVYRGLPADAAILPGGIVGHMGFKVWVGNLAFLQTIAVPTFGSNGALWSLANEWWYYVLFPLLVVPGRRRVARWASAAFLAWWLGSEILIYFVVWLLGAGVALLAQWRVEYRQWALATSASLLVMTLSLVVARFSLAPQVFADMLVAVSFAAFLYLLLQRPVTSAAGGGSTFSIALWAATAGFSYTLYAIHLPVLVFIHAAFVSLGLAAWQPSFGTALAGIGIGGVIVISSWLLSLVTERRTETFRARIVLPTLRTASIIGRPDTLRRFKDRER